MSEGETSDIAAIEFLKSEMNSGKEESLKRISIEEELTTPRKENNSLEDDFYMEELRQENDHLKRENCLMKRNKAKLMEEVKEVLKEKVEFHNRYVQLQDKYLELLSQDPEPRTAGSGSEPTDQGTQERFVT